MTHQYDLDLPAHLLTEQVQTDIYKQASSGVVDYGQLSPITELIIQFQNKLAEARNSSVNTLRDRMLKQEQGEIQQEEWLRERLKLLRFPDVENVYVARDYYFYVTFSRLLTVHEIMQADATINATIERTPPLRNRYRVVVNRLDKEEA